MSTASRSVGRECVEIPDCIPGPELSSPTVHPSEGIPVSTRTMREGAARIAVDQRLGQWFGFVAILRGAVRLLAFLDLFS